MGIFILIVIGILILFILISAVHRANTRIYYADKHTALKNLSDGKGRLPSWTYTSEIDVFTNAVYKLLIKHGVPPVQAQLLMSNKHTGMVALYTAGNMEAQGASFIQQELAATDVLLDLWHNADHDYLFSE